MHAQIQGDIVGGTLAPGEPLVEMALAERYGVSRTPIREALKRLETAGLVEQFARGYRVIRHTPEDILDIYEVRIALEQAAARGAALRRTPFDLAKIRRAHEAMANVADGDSGQASAGSFAFHQAIWDGAHNSMLVKTLTNLQHRIEAFSTTTLSYPGRAAGVRDEHAEILRAIEDGDADLAASLAVRHMSRSRDVRLELYSTAASRGVGPHVLQAASIARRHAGRRSGAAFAARVLRHLTEFTRRAPGKR